MQYMTAHNTPEPSCSSRCDLGTQYRTCRVEFSMVSKMLKYEPGKRQHPAQAC